ncbi:alpha-glucosidase [Tsukamurella soli]|uniref:Alpha-glucosidase n=1 Tax=Tsukamurella soli TaxID=644556 RepID=A0ABP8JI56_9ACTN
MAGGFLQGGAAETVIEENVTPASGFTISDRDLVRFDAQTIDSAASDGAALTLGGRVRSTSGRTTDYTMSWTAVGPKQLRFQIALHDRGVNRVFLRYRADPGEQFWGFGQQLTYFDQRGRLLPILVQEHGVGRGLPIITEAIRSRFGARTAGSPVTTEVAVPHYISSINRSLMLESSQYSVFDLRTPGMVEIEQFDDRLSGQILYGTSPLDLIETYTGIAGRMRRLPDWVDDGAIVCAQGGTEVVRKLITTLADAHIPVSALWIQDWTGVNHTAAGKQVQWNWILDTGHYPDWAELQNDLATRLGAKTVLYVNPFLSHNNGYRHLFDIAAARGYLVKHRDGTPYQIRSASFEAGLIDLTNPATRAWITDVIKSNLIGNRAVGWMADFGEALPFDSVLHSGENPADFHNRYPEEWARINRDAIAETGHDTDGLFFSRSGFTRSPAISTLFWVGDQLQTWDAFDGLKSAITGCLSGGISGFSHVHSDIGGFDSIVGTIPGTTKEVALVRRTKELFLRWAEHSAFTSVMRTHQGISPADAWQIDQDADTLVQFRRMVALYRAWAPYRRRLSAEAARTGYPVMRAMALTFPQDSVAFDYQFQYTLGDALLLAPVTEPGARTAVAYLPRGNWYHPWTGSTYRHATGATVTVPAPIGRPPAFINLQSAFASELRRSFDMLV